MFEGKLTMRILRPDGSEYVDMNQLYMNDPTEFNGEYTLAKSK
jgi:hypothetical protein